MEFEVYNRSRVRVAAFANEQDRDDFMDMMKEKYPDCGFYTKGGNRG